MPTTVVVSLGTSHIVYGTSDKKKAKLLRTLGTQLGSVNFSRWSNFRYRHARNEAWLRLWTEGPDEHDPRDVTNAAFASIKDGNIRLVVVADPMMGAAAREAICKAAFSNATCQSVAIACQPAMALRSGPSDTNTTTGLVVRLGSTSCDAIPVVDGQSLCMSLVTCGDVAGGIVGELNRLLEERGYSFTTAAERRIVRDVYLRLGIVAKTAEEAPAEVFYDADVERNYELPDGQVIAVGRERIVASEALFRRTEDKPQLALMIHQAIQRCPAQWRDEVASNIVVHGTLADVDGLVERLAHEIGVPLRRLPADAAWRGACLVGGCGESMPARVLTREEFDAAGPSGINLGFC